MERRRQWQVGLVVGLLGLIALVTWMVVLTNTHSDLREAAGEQCSEDVYARYGGEGGSAEVFRMYVGEPDPNRFEYTVADTQSRFRWTCLASQNDDGAWDLTVFKQD